MQSSSDIFHRVVNLRRIIAFLGKTIKKRCTPIGNCIGLTLTCSFNIVHQFTPCVTDHYSKPLIWNVYQ